MNFSIILAIARKAFQDTQDIQRGQSLRAPKCKRGLEGIENELNVKKKTDSQHRVLLLDLGNVVFELDTGPIQQWFLEHIDLHGEDLRARFFKIEALFDRGDLQPQEFVERLREAFGLRASDSEFFKVWVQCWRRDMAGVDELLRALPAHISACALSNTNITHLEYFLKTKPILQRFEKLYLSYQMRLRKPEPEIFRQVIDDLDLPGSQIVFFDDIEENVEAARQQGIDAYVFESVEQIRSILNLEIEQQPSNLSQRETQA